MRTKRGGYKPTQVAACNTPKGWRYWGQDKPLEPLNAGLKRICAREGLKNGTDTPDTRV